MKVNFNPWQLLTFLATIAILLVIRALFGFEVAVLVGLAGAAIAAEREGQ